jgi:hypothetical protein
VQFNAAGQVDFKLKTPWRDSTTHLVMSQLELMQQLAVPMTPPRPALWLWQLLPLKGSCRVLNHITSSTALGRNQPDIRAS